MAANLRHLPSEAFERLSPQDAADVLATARDLQRSARAGTTQPLLRGKHFALLCDADECDAATLFRQAVLELGAQFTHVRPTLSEFSPAAEVQQCARVLGRLYDAVECQGVPSALVHRIASAAGVPVFDGIAGAVHPTARLAAAFGDDAAAADNRRYVLQAVLLSTMA